MLRVRGTQKLAAAGFGFENVSPSAQKNTLSSTDLLFILQ